MRSLAVAVVATLTLLASGSVAAGQSAEAAAPPQPQPPAAPIPYPFLKPAPAPAARPKAPTAQPHPRPKPAGAEDARATSPAADAAARPTTTAPPAGQPIPATELERYVDGALGAALSRDHLAGAAVAIVQNGMIVLAKGYGFADRAKGRRVDPARTLFRLGPVSQTFTWIALMRQVEAGRVGLDQPINTYLPERVQVRNQGFDQPVRVVNLMDHSAGFEERILGRLFEREPAQIRPLEVYLRQERPRRVRPPGAASSFSPYDAALAGEAAANVAGKPFETLVEDEILRPLGLGRTTFREPRPALEGLPAPMPAALAADAAKTYRWGSAGFELRPYAYVGHIAPAMSASSTAADMGRYMLALLAGGRLDGAVIYGPAAAKAFRTPLRPLGPGMNGWAHGFETVALPGGRQGYGASGGALDTYASLVVVPDLDLGVFVAVNSAGGAEIADALPRLLVEAFYAPQPALPRSGSPQLWDERHAYAGDYLSSRRAYVGLEGFVDRLQRGAQVRVTPDGRLSVSMRQGAQAWAPDGPPGMARFAAEDGSGRQLAFALADGRALAFHPADGKAIFERVGPWRSPAVLAWLAAAAGAAALATLGGLAVRDRRDLRQTSVQAQASVVQSIQAGLWLLALGLFGWWWRTHSDAESLMFRWPSGILITASACALVAAALTVSTLAALPSVWRGGRRLDSWTTGRKLAFTATVLIYVAFSAALAVWGALTPWAS